MKSKVTVVGAGNVGATAAQQLFSQGNADLVLVDVVEGCLLYTSPSPRD